jgi:polysaccharide biosynthesis protein PslH
MRAGICVVPDDHASAFAAEIIRFAGNATLRRETGLAARADARRWNARQQAELRRSLAGA